MKVRRIKKGVVLFVYGFIVFSFGVSIYFINKNLNNNKEKTTYVNDSIFSNDIPVVKQDNVIKRPYNQDTIEIICNFYDYKNDEQNQQKSIVYYDNTYLQNSGVIYGQNDMFDVIAIYDGEVIKIDENSVLGKIVEIRHSNDVISTYQILSDINVSLNQNVKQGDVIGKSGTSKIINNNKQMLYFELSIRGEYVNIENYYDKKLNEL